MNWQTQPAAAESQAGHADRPGQELTPEAHSPESSRLVRIRKTTITPDAGGKETGLFTMSLGEETIDLLPFKNWGQLDIHKWAMRGKLPGTPAGLEVTPDHVKLSGEIVSIKDPEGCAKLEKLFAEWLALEKESLELARRKSLAKPQATGQAIRPAEPQTLRYEVEVDKGGQVHIRCLLGKEVLAAIGLNVPGFNNLASQGLLRKPHALKVGALHDWVELDGVFFSFEKGNNDSVRLAQALNQSYAPAGSFGQGKDIVVLENAASSTGFDIQFPATVGGTIDSRRRPLNEETLELLQDPNKCGLLQDGLIVKLTRPNLIFKQKTQDGGERYLERCAENLARLTDDEGNEKLIDLSQPVNYLHLGAIELTAVFNHPAVNRHSKAAPPGNRAGQEAPKVAPIVVAREPAPPPAPAPPSQVKETAPPQRLSHPVPAQPLPAEPAPVEHTSRTIKQAPVGDSPPPAPPTLPTPNLWLKPILAQLPIRYDWFGCLVYRKIAEYVGSSREGKFGTSACWAAALGEVEEIENLGFKGVFLTEKGGLGFLNEGYLARFHKGVCIIGTPESALEGIGIELEGVGMDNQGKVIFIVKGDYWNKFGVPDAVVAQEFSRLLEAGARIMNVREILESPDPVAVVWTVPAQQADPNEPEALESFPPEAALEDHLVSAATA